MGHRRGRRSATYLPMLACVTFGVSACGGRPVGTAPVELLGATAVATNWEGSCAVASGGKVFCWGINRGELAIAIDGIAGATEVSVGNGFSCARLAGGAVECWGDGFSGELGNGWAWAASETPVTVSGITSATALSAGYGHACAVLADGTVQCWGANDYGQLGIGATNLEPTDQNAVPNTVAGIGGAANVSAGQYGTCAVLLDGSVWCWGENGFGQLGDGTTTDSSVPVAVAGVIGAVGVCTAADHSCAVIADGTVQCWGANAFGENGNDAPLRNPSPVPVAGISSALAVSCGWAHTCAVVSDGSIRCWGGDGGSMGYPLGALGNPAVTLDCTWTPDPYDPASHSPQQTVSYETPCSPTPVAASEISNGATVAAGYYSTCAVLSDGSVRCWGDNQSGQLGDGSTSNRIVPVTVMAQGGQ